MEYIYGNPDKTQLWEDVASIFAAHDSLKSLQTSSLPLVQFWKPNGEFPSGNARKVLELCFETVNLENEFRNAELCFEYPVPVHKDCEGKGKASMTDLMIITDHHAIALEAKWKECGKAYPSISKWETPNGGTNDNRTKVRDGWLQYINTYLKDRGFAEISPKKEDYKIIPYQMLHRIASACAVAKEKGKKAVVIYQLFYSSDSDEKNNTMDNGWVNVTLAKVNTFATKLQEGFTTLFKDLKKPVPIEFCIMKTKVTKGEGFDTAMAKCKKSGDLNELFLEMQHRDIYSFDWEPYKP